MFLRDGFHGERLCVVPRPALKAALSRPVTRKLMVSDAGWFPEALRHARTRPRGVEAAIVMVCTQGAGWVEIAGARHRIVTGCAIILPPGTPHSYGSSEDHPWTIWWCHILGSDVGDLTSATGVTQLRPVLRLRQMERAVSQLEEIVTGLERAQSEARFIGVSGAAFKLMTVLAGDQLLPERGEPLERAMRHLEERYDSQVRVGELAALVGVSASHLTSLFRRATGGGVLAHQASLRMASARQLLERTNAPVNEVAAEVGYADAFYFSRYFRRVHGVSPSAYRAERRADS